MEIVFVAAESTPFVKVGGLADVVGTLPPHLQRMGHNVHVLLPHHGTINDSKFGIEHYETFSMPWHGGMAEVHVSHVEENGVPVYFIRSWPYFNPGEMFIYSDDEGIDVGRFVFFALASLHFTRRLAQREGWQPDIFHVHDWHTALVPFLLRRVFFADETLNRAGVLLTVHNMKYQGWGIGWHLNDAGLPDVDHAFLHALGKADNALAVGMAYSSMLNTVSPRYATEIVEPANGYGLDGLLDARRFHLLGILNGIDTDRWNPATSENIATNYTPETLDKRVENKRALQERLGLPVDDDVAVIGTVIRLVDQKGPAIMLPAMWHMLRYAHVQFVLLGTGFYHHETEAWKLGDAHREKARIMLTFDEPLAEQIYAGSDMFLMPSLFEPCGIGQMIAMRYGALPVVREVGGLADTVTPDVGFLFKDFHPGAMQWVIGQALDVYYNHPDDWHARQRRAMRKDFDWKSSAAQYEALYERTLDVHRSYT